MMVGHTGWSLDFKQRPEKLKKLAEMIRMEPTTPTRDEKLRAEGRRIGIEEAVKAIEDLRGESEAAREKAQTTTYRLALKDEIDSLNAAIERVKALLEKTKP